MHLCQGSAIFGIHTVYQIFQSQKAGRNIIELIFKRNNSLGQTAIELFSRLLH